MSDSVTHDLPLWRPSRERVEASAMYRFLREAGVLAGQFFADYAALHRWSVDNPRSFWPLLARFCGARFHREPDSVLEGEDDVPGARWFEGARLNHAHNLLAPGSGVALICHDERGRRRVLSRDELRAEVARVAAGLRALGVGRGDRVAGFVANAPEAVIAALAAGAVGAIWSACSPDFGVAGVLDRFGQITPKVLFAVDGYYWSGKRIDTRAVVAEVARALPDLAAVVVIGFAEDRPDIAAIPTARHFSEFGESGVALEFSWTEFSAPLVIVYSSGTTGPPKCIVHRAGGVLLQHLKEQVLHTDIGPSDVVFYYTTCGWMMWNWLIGALATGASVVLYDGSPFHPDPGVLWRIAAAEGITVFGTSAKYLSALEKSGCPRAGVSLRKLRAVLSTGSPLAPEGFDFVYRDIGTDLLLASISGGTDILSCFALGNPLLPVWRGELQCAGLGMAVDIFDQSGKSLREGRGELVCTRGFPSMPLGFWNDSDGQRFHAAYFERFAGVWAHGDYAEWTSHGGLVIHGRSDAVLNPGGVRIGTAEIYRQVEKLDAVLESLAVAQPWQGDERIVLFVVLREGLRLDEALRVAIREVIRRNTTPRHVPAKILQVPAMPRTRSGKLVELAVTAVVRGEAVTNAQAIANPEALESFRDRAELSAD
jgi:acetoacetyl-CoA synthetase